MARLRSRQAETEDVNQRRLKRGAVKRQHIGPHAVGHTEIAPGVVGDTHLHPTTIERVRDLAAGAGVGQLLVVSATAQSFASGGAYVDADSIVYQHGFAAVTAAGDSIVWPVDAVGEIQVEFAWDTYDGGGTIEIEVDGTVPSWGTVATGTSGSVGRGSRLVHINEGAAVKVKVTQGSGSAKTGSVVVEFSIPDPAVSAAARYASVVLADGPVAYWQLGEAAGTSAVDVTGNGHNGTYAGTFTLGASGVMRDGSNDTALDVTGVSGSGVTGADWADLEFTGLAPYSVECWFEADSFPAVSGSNILVQKQVAGSGAGWELIVAGGPSPSVNANRGSAGGAEVESAPGSIAVGQRHHTVWTFDGASSRLYLDGALVATAGGASALAVNTVPLSIGYDSDSVGVAELDGRIDEVAIYDRALLVEEITEHYTVGGGL